MSNLTEHRTPISVTLEPAITEQLVVLARAQGLNEIEMLRHVLRAELRKSGLPVMPPRDR